MNKVLKLIEKFSKKYGNCYVTFYKSNDSFTTFLRVQVIIGKNIHERTLAFDDVFEEKIDYLIEETEHYFDYYLPRIIINS